MATNSTLLLVVALVFETGWFKGRIAAVAMLIARISLLLVLLSLRPNLLASAVLITAYDPSLLCPSRFTGAPAVTPLSPTARVSSLICPSLIRTA